MEDNVNFNTSIYKRSTICTQGYNDDEDIHAVPH